EQRAQRADAVLGGARQRSTGDRQEHAAQHALRRCRHVFGAQRADERRQAGLGLHRQRSEPYSTFWTCSCSCSIATFMSTEIAVIPIELDFEPSVFASRSSSWIRNSRRLPTSPPLASRRAISSRCERRRASSSAT